MKVVLKPGDRLIVEIEDSATTPEAFEILYDYGSDGRLRVLAAEPDSDGRGGPSAEIGFEIYNEVFDRNRTLFSKFDRYKKLVQARESHDGQDTQTLDVMAKEILATWGDMTMEDKAKAYEEGTAP